MSTSGMKIRRKDYDRAKKILDKWGSKVAESRTIVEQWEKADKRVVGMPKSIPILSVDVDDDGNMTVLFQAEVKIDGRPTSQPPAAASSPTMKETGSVRVATGS